MAIDKSQVQNIYPLTPLQDGMLFHAESAPESDAYFEQWSLRLQGEVLPELVQASWNALFARHEVFRSVFTPGDGKRPLQVILRQREVTFERVDLRQHPEAEAALEALRVADRQRGFQLGGEPLVRVTLVQLVDGWEIIWSHHHIILDGWSLGVVQAEFMQIYAALRRGVDPALAVTTPFSRFVKTLSAAPDQAFWRDYLAGFETLTGLPQRSAAGERLLCRQVLDLGAEQVAGLDGLCRSLGITLSAAMQALWGVLLARYAYSDDVVFGYVVSGRPPELPGVESMVGLFINTLPLRVRLQADETWREFLLRLHAQAAALTARQQTPLAYLQQTASLPSLFDHVLALENYPLEEALQRVDAAQTGFEVVRASSYDRTHYGFDLAIIPGPGSLRLRFSFDAGQYEAPLFARIGEQLSFMLDQLLANPDAQPCRSNILPPAHWAEVALRHNQTKAAYPAHASIVELFDAQVAAYPDAAAVLAPHEGDAWLSYADVQARAHALAVHLQAQGIAPGSFVALCLPPSSAAVVAILGILKAGCAYVPVDPEYPPERQLFMLQDSGAVAVITNRAVADSLPGDTLRVLIEDVASRSDAPLAAAPQPDDLAYVIYTSGSTGTPKGCQITHRNVVRLLLNEQHDFRFDRNDVWVVAHSLCFDFSVWELYGALLYGGRVLLPARELVRDVPAFRALLARARVTVLNQTPQAFYNLIALEASEAHSLGEHLRYVIFGGDKLDLAALRPWIAFYPPEQVQLVNMYGITETTVHVTFGPLSRAQIEQGSGASPIGRPLPETTLYIVDRHLNLQPLGATGEMLVGGTGVCAGYLNRPDLTAERFIADTFSGTGRLYRSGDLARRDSQGNLIYLGRNDHQVKIRGHRIEPSEVEQGLLQLAGVEKAAVLAERSDAGVELVAYVVSQRAGADIRAEYAAHAAAHMLPNIVVPCAALPLTSNGKLDRAALRALRLAASPVVDQAQEAPQGERELMLAKVWAEVLAVPSLGRDANYLALGGDSIKSIQILAKLRGLGWQLQVKDLFRYPTVASLAPYLIPLKATQAAAAAQGTFPLTPIQRRFFAEHRVDSHHYNHAVLLRCTAHVSESALQASLQALYHAHSALRLRFRHEADGSVLQWFADAQQVVPLAVVDLTDAPDDALLQHSASLQTGLDLSNGPLFRAALYRHAAGDRLLLVAHHLCVDGVSWRILLEDLNTALQQALAAQAIKLPAASDAFSRWSELLHAKPLHTKLIAEQGPLWAQMDAAAESTALVELLGASNGNYAEADEALIEWDAAATDNLVKHSAAAYQTNPGELLLTAVCRAFYAAFGLSQLQLALEGHGREAIVESDTSRTVGWFTALYPLLIALPPTDLGRQIRETKEAMRRVPHGGVGYGVLRYLAGQALQAQPRIAFNYLGGFDLSQANALLAACDDPIAPAASPHGPRPFALEIAAIVVDGRLRLTLGYARGHIAAEVIARLQTALQTELNTVVNHCLAQNQTQLTPSDLTYTGLSLDELEDIFDDG